MATVIFYEKPGCVNNTRQKKQLAAAGHRVIAKNLLTEPWQSQQLRAFFGNLPIRSWFNYSAPALKLGEIDPGRLNEQQALALMIDDPLLIRRPLLKVDNLMMTGFDQLTIDDWIGLSEVNPLQNMESCEKTLTKASGNYTQSAGIKIDYNS